MGTKKFIYYREDIDEEAEDQISLEKIKRERKNTYRPIQMRKPSKPWKNRGREDEE